MNVENVSSSRCKRTLVDRVRVELSVQQSGAAIVGWLTAVSRGDCWRPARALVGHVTSSVARVMWSARCAVWRSDVVCAVGGESVTVSAQRSAAAARGGPSTTVNTVSVYRTTTPRYDARCKLAVGASPGSVTGVWRRSRPDRPTPLPL